MAIHRDCKAAVKAEYERIRAKYPKLKSTTILARSKWFVRTLCFADTAIMKSRIASGDHEAI